MENYNISIKQLLQKLPYVTHSVVPQSAMEAERKKLFLSRDSENSFLRKYFKLPCMKLPEG